MEKFFQRLMGSGGRPAPAARQPWLTLAAFGKHPGWNDHIPGIGLETEALAQLKQAMYVTGIGGRIDSGVWKALTAEKRLEGFDHTFLCLRGGHVITGCLFSSEDGRRRKEYPMVLCVDAGGVHAAFVLPKAQVELDRLRDACRAAVSAEQVTTECRLSQDRLRGILGATTPPTTVVPLPAEARRRFLDHPDFAPDRVGLLRVLHELGTAGDAGRPGSAGLVVNGRSCHLRLPLAADSRNDSILRWAEFFRCAVSPASPLLLIARVGLDWLDVIIGEPTSDDLFCLQASPLALPLTTRIPYDLTPELKPRLLELEVKFLGVESSLRAIGSSPMPAPGMAGAGGKTVFIGKGPGLWMLSVVGLVILVVGIGIWWFISRPGSAPGAKSLAVADNSAPTKVAVVAPAPLAGQLKTNDPVREAARDKSEAENKRLAEAKRVAEEKANTELQAKEANRLRAEAEVKRLAEEKKAAEAKATEESGLHKPVVEKVGNDPSPSAEAKRAEDAKAQAQARENDADLAQIALAQGNYERVLELCQKWPGGERFQPLLKLAAAETNQLRQVQEFLQAGNYNPILTNRLPENSRFKEIWTTANGEKKILDQASAEFAGGDYTFLERSEVQSLQAKPPFQKLLQDGGAEAGQLVEAKALQTANQPQAARDFIVQGKLSKPPFVKIQQWAAGELERIAREQDDRQAAQGFFEKADYPGALALCQKYPGLPAFDALAASINEEQKVLADAGAKLSAGDYTFVAELLGREYATKPPFTELRRKGAEEQNTLGELDKLKQNGNWQALLGQLKQQPSAVVGKPPFENLRKWAQARAEEQAELRKKDPVWLDAKLEVLLVRLSILKPTDPKIKTPAARQEQVLEGALSLTGVDYYLNQVNVLENEYKKGGWLEQGDRKKLLNDLKEKIKYGN